MIKVAMVKTNGEVGYIISPSSDSDYKDGNVYGENTAKIIPIECNDDEYIVQKYWDILNNSWVDKGKKPNEYYDWLVNCWVFNSKNFKLAIRVKRSKLLHLSDWTQIPDSDLSKEKRQEWADYRKKLRDLPSITNSTNCMSDVVFPIKPL